MVESVFSEKNLTLRVVLCMVAGVLIGKYLPAISGREMTCLRASFPQRIILCQHAISTYPS
ncbi:MAG: hypothetical protein EOM59_15600 [Clostridia bacterium]|nr:hypothetical protein [Clostridia bacterium]